jgi:hypothetical protein
VKLLREVMQSHADPTDPNYNQCDTSPCQWCEDAKKLIGPNAEHHARPEAKRKDVA